MTCERIDAMATLRRLVAPAVLLGLVACSTDDEHRGGDVADVADAGDDGADSDAHAWAALREAATASRSRHDELEAEHQGETCLWRRWQSVFGQGWASRATFDGDELVAWEFCETDAECFGCSPEFTCETGEAGASPTAEWVPEGVFDPMSALYLYCIGDLLARDPSAWEATFETDEQGVMSACAVWEEGCLDDCREGVDIWDFEWTACDFDTPQQ